MAIYDKQIKEEEEERKKKLEALRKWRPDSSVAVPESTASRAQVQSAIRNDPSTTFSVAKQQDVQRGYDPRFDDPDYGKKKKDKPDTGRERATFDRPTRDGGPSAPGLLDYDPYSTSAGYDPLSSAQLAPEKWFDPRTWRKEPSDPKDTRSNWDKFNEFMQQSPADVRYGIQKQMFKGMQSPSIGPMPYGQGPLTETETHVRDTLRSYGVQPDVIAKIMAEYPISTGNTENAAGQVDSTLKRMWLAEGQGDDVVLHEGVHTIDLMEGTEKERREKSREFVYDMIHFSNEYPDTRSGEIISSAIHDSYPRESFDPVHSVFADDAEINALELKAVIVENLAGYIADMPEYAQRHFSDYFGGGVVPGVEQWTRQDSSVPSSSESIRNIDWYLGGFPAIYRPQTRVWWQKLNEYMQQTPAEALGTPEGPETKADDLWRANWERRRKDDKVGTYEGPGMVEAWQNAPTFSEIITGTDQNDPLTNTVGALYENAPKAAAAAGAGVQQLAGMLPEEGRLSSGLELLGDVTAQTFDAFGVPAQAMQSVQSRKGTLLGESASAAGEAALNVLANQVDLQGNVGQSFVDEYNRLIEEKETARGGDYSKLSPEQKEAAAWSQMVAYSGTESQAAVYDSLLTQDEQVEALEKAAAQAMYEGNPDAAAQASAAAEDLKNKTPKDFVEENTRLGPQILGEMILDPLNLIDAGTALFKLGPVARRAGRATSSVMDVAESDILKNMDELAELANKTFAANEGKTGGVFRWGKEFFGSTSQSKAATDRANVWDIVTTYTGQIKDKAQARDVADAFTNNPTKLVEVLEGQGRGTKALGSPEKIESTKKLLPWLRDKVGDFKSLKGDGEFDPALFAVELYDTLGEGAEAFYGADKSGNLFGFKTASDFMRKYMSEQFLNLTPRHLFRNGVSALGHLMVDGQNTFQPIDNIVTDLARKFGGSLPTPRVDEAYGALSEAGKITEGAGGYYGGSNKIHDLARKIPVYGQIMFDASGNPRWAGAGTFGEQNFYTRGFHTRLVNVIKEQWDNVVSNNLPQRLAELGVEDNFLRNIVDRVVEDGIKGNRDDILESVTKMVTGNGDTFSLRSTGLEDDIFANNENYTALRNVFDDVRRGAVSPEDAELRVTELFENEKSWLADVLNDSGGTPPSRKYWSATDDMADATEAARATEYAAKAAGQAQAGKQASKQFLSWYQKQSSTVYAAYKQALEGAGDFAQGGRDVIMDTWTDIQNLKNRARIQQGKAYEAWTNSARKDGDWQRYEQTVQNVYDSMFNQQRQILQDVPLKAQEAKSGVYARKYDNAIDYLDRVTNVTPEELVDDIVTGTTGESIQAQRKYVDYYSADAYNKARQYGTDISSMDILASAEDDVQMAALMAASDAKNISLQAQNGQITWGDADKARRQIWSDWAQATRKRYQAAGNDILRSAGQPTTGVAAGPPPSLDDIRRLAGQEGVATATDAGVPFDKHLLNVANKELGSSYKRLDDLDEDDLRALEQALEGRAQRKAAGVADDAEELTSTYYTVDGDNSIVESYNANTKKNFAGRGSSPPVVADIAEYRYKQIAEAERSVLDALRQTSAQPGLPPVAREQAQAIISAVQGLLPQYDDVLVAAKDAAKAGADVSMLDYNARRGFDTMIAAAVPYHYWYTRSAKNWLERMVAHPGLMASYFKTDRAADIYRDQEDMPQRYEGNVPVPFTDGRKWMPNPLDYLLPVRELYETNGFSDPEKATSTAGKMVETAGVMGFGTFPLLDVGIKYAEGRGDEVDWGNLAYPYHPVNDTYKAVTGKELIPALQRPFEPYLEGRAGGELAVAGEFSPEAVRYADQIIANEENGLDPMTNIPEHMQEEAMAARQAASSRQAKDSATRSVSSWFGPKFANYPEEEATARKAQQEYIQAGYDWARPGGSQTARSNVLERNPWLSAWWAKNDLLPDNIADTELGAETQTSQYWDEYIAISEADTAAVADLIKKNPSVKPSEVREFRQKFFDQKDALGEKYPDVKEYDSRRDRTKDAMNPFEAATQMVMDVMRYEPPGEPEWPGDKATDEEKQEYYRLKGLYDEEKADHLDRVFTQMADMDNAAAIDNDKAIVAQIVTSRYAPDLMRGYDLRFASPEEVAWAEQWDLQGEMKGADYDRWAAEKQERVDRVTLALGPGAASAMTAYLDLPKGQERWDYKDQHPEVGEALDVAFNPERHVQAKEMFGEDIYQLAGTWPGPRKSNKEEWDKWAKEIGDENVDRFYAYYGWQKEQRDAAKSDDAGKEGFTPAPNWMDVAQTGADARNKGRTPIGYESYGDSTGAPLDITSRSGPIEYQSANQTGDPYFNNPYPSVTVGGQPVTRPSGNYPVRERAEYEDVGLEVNPLQGFPAGTAGAQGGVTPEKLGFKATDYNPLPGYNALPKVTPDEMMGDPAKSLPPGFMDEVMAAALAGEDGAVEALIEAVNPSGGGGGGGYGGGGGGYGGGGGGYPQRVNPYLQRLMAWRRENWFPYYDKAEAARRISSVGPQNVRSWRRSV